MPIIKNFRQSLNSPSVRSGSVAPNTKAQVAGEAQSVFQQINQASNQWIQTVRKNQAHNRSSNNIGLMKEEIAEHEATLEKTTDGRIADINRLAEFARKTKEKYSALSKSRQEHAMFEPNADRYVSGKIASFTVSNTKLAVREFIEDLDKSTDALFNHNVNNGKFKEVVEQVKSIRTEIDQSGLLNGHRRQQALIEVTGKLIDGVVANHYEKGNVNTMKKILNDPLTQGSMSESRRRVWLKKIKEVRDKRINLSASQNNVSVNLSNPTSNLTNVISSLRGLGGAQIAHGDRNRAVGYQYMAKQLQGKTGEYLASPNAYAKLVDGINKSKMNPTSKIEATKVAKQITASAARAIRDDPKSFFGNNGQRAWLETKDPKSWFSKSQAVIEINNINSGKKDISDYNEQTKSALVAHGYNVFLSTEPTVKFGDIFTGDKKQVEQALSNINSFKTYLPEHVTGTETSFWPWSNDVVNPVTEHSLNGTQNLGSAMPEYMMSYLREKPNKSSQLVSFLKNSDFSDLNTIKKQKAFETIFHNEDFRSFLSTKVGRTSISGQAIFFKRKDRSDSQVKSILNSGISKGSYSKVFTSDIANRLNKSNVKIFVGFDSVNSYKDNKFFYYMKLPNSQVLRLDFKNATGTNTQSFTLDELTTAIQSGGK